ncbi:c-type cytochrome [Gemmatimonas phototrophica]|uniref:c-type cytochrome n=1 Tax=Gemmatimonas phototrophica TaxID=1379270 RepID=UPI0006A6F4F9|nr:c-type cytochrome [Gemmatimonas phototrophica]
MRVPSLSLFALTTLIVGCGEASAPADANKTDTKADAKAVVFTESAWKPPLEADIPADSMGASIKRGLYLLRFTPESLPNYATSNLRCTSCHQQDGLKLEAAPLTGSHARFPKYMPRSGTVIALADRVNYCFTRSLAGNAIPAESREMTDILAYLAFISKDIPVGVKIAGADGILSMKDTLVGDVARGEALFTAKTCVTCHGANGEGNGPIPALWGAKSYSVGASMTRHERAASFIMHNMPQTAPGSLTPQEAFDLSAYINSHPRPDSPGKENDWPMGGAPADVPYNTAGHKAFNPPPLLPRANPRGALVPNPPVVGRGGR